MSTAPYPNAQAIFYQQYAAVRRDEVVGILLALFLGCFGVHHFYLRRTGLGILYVCFSWTGITAILGFVECFFMPGRVREFNAIQAAGIAAALGMAVPAWGQPVNVTVNMPGAGPGTAPTMGTAVAQSLQACSRCQRANPPGLASARAVARRFNPARGHVAATYRAVMLTKEGGPEVLQAADLPLEPPGPGQLRIRVEAAGVGATDVVMLQGNYPFAPKIPFVPGYEAAGIVETIGPGVTGFALGQRVAALTVYGSFGEYLVREAEHFLPVPAGVSARDAAAVILNYGTAWQMIHRVAKVQPGQTALLTGAAGGVGTAALQLLRLAGVKAYGAASAAKHPLVRSLGAIPIDSREKPLNRLVRALEPGGVDFVFDAIGGANIGPSIGALRPGGLVVGFGFMAAPGILDKAAMFLNLFVGARLRGRRGTFYGISALYRKDPGPLREDLPKIFALLAEKKVDPLIMHTLPLLEARQAFELLMTGSVQGKIVLTA